MTDRRPYRLFLPWVLAFLALAATGGFARADEPPAESSEEESSEGEVYKNYLRWSLASEADNFGFDVYRGESEDGPFERITEKPILGAGSTDEPTHYEFIDENLDPYATYWYFVESISMTGQRSPFSPTVKKAPKLERESSSEPEGEEPG